MNEAEALAGAELRMPAATLGPLPEGTFHHHELIGCEVRDSTDVLLGRVSGGRRADGAQPAGRRRGSAARCRSR